MSAVWDDEDTDGPGPASLVGTALGCLALLVAVLVLGTLAFAVPPAPTGTDALPPCAHEDGSDSTLPCLWDGDTMGNGVGRSFVLSRAPWHVDGMVATYVP